jgi:hypothetical protein
LALTLACGLDALSTLIPESGKKLDLFKSEMLTPPQLTNVDAKTRNTDVVKVQLLVMMFSQFSFNIKNSLFSRSAHKSMEIYIMYDKHGIKKVPIVPTLI